MNNDDERWLPVERACPRELFTDRKRELEALYWWESIARKGMRPMAFLSPRRMGKTALLMEFYEHLFWDQKELVPFYFEVPKEGIRWRELSIRYAFEFVRQYLCFTLRERALAAPPVRTVGRRDLEALEPHVRKLEGALIVRLREEFLAAMTDPEDGPLWGRAHTMPFAINNWESPKTVTILDEFQWLDDRVIYPEGEIQRDLTGSYFTIASAYNGNLLVAGSALTIMARDVLGGGMNGRFSPYRLGPLSPDAALELALTCSEFYGVPTNLACAELICKSAQYNPYYVEVVFHESGRREGRVSARSDGRRDSAILARSLRGHLAPHQ